MEVIRTDVVVVGGGGAGLRAAIAAHIADPGLSVALLSKVVPMRSHTVAAEGGSAGVIRGDDSLALHFDDTVSGGDWLCDQDAVQYFVEHCAKEMVQLEHWGCPWSRHDDGSINVRFFGGMKVQRTWFAADKSGFHMLHTLFQTSLRYDAIRRYDEFFVSDLIVEDGRARGVLAIEIATGAMFLFEAKAVILCTGGAARVYRQNTNAGIVTGDGMAMAYRHGVALRDMEFVQYHPTALPGTGILITEGCRGEGAILTNKDGYRYLQDYGLGPPDPWPRAKAMELGPRDRCRGRPGTTRCARLRTAAQLRRRNPKYVSILAPLTTCTLTMLCGTGHVVYTMLPIIYDIAIKNGIRPERPMAASSIASQMGIIASPVSVAVVSLVAFLAKATAGAPVIDFVTLLSVTIPSTLAGVLMVGTFSWFRGKDLALDADFQKLIKDPEGHKQVYGESTTLLGQELTAAQWTAMWIFVAAIAVVALLGAVETLRSLLSDLATIQFDRSGTTGIGKYVINHSFIAPGLIGVASSCVFGNLIAGARGLV